MDFQFQVFKTNKTFISVLNLEEKEREKITLVLQEVQPAILSKFKTNLNHPFHCTCTLESVVKLLLLRKIV